MDTQQIAAYAHGWNDAACGRIIAQGATLAYMAGYMDALSA